VEGDVTILEAAKDNLPLGQTSLFRRLQDILEKLHYETELIIILKNHKMLKS
jgi:hypothetical protein